MGEKLVNWLVVLLSLSSLGAVAGGILGGGASLFFIGLALFVLAATLSIVLARKRGDGILDLISHIVDGLFW